MAIVPPLSLYDDYWPDIRETVPDIAEVMALIQRLVVVGEENRIELVKTRARVERLYIQRKALEEKINDLERIINQEAEVVDIWCIDYTLEIPVGTTIGTMEIPGEATRMNIQRGYAESDDTGYATAEYNDVRDGLMQPVLPVALHSGAGWFFNAAMKAGWQKWFPLFRYGTITKMIENEDGTRNCNIDLSLSTRDSTILSGFYGLLSTGHIHVVADPTGLNIDQTDTLENVPFQYMDCDDIAFDIGDEVVIEFRELQLMQWRKQLVEKEVRVVESYFDLDADGLPVYRGAGLALKTVLVQEWVPIGTGPARDWSQPVVIGFQHDPQPCDFAYYVQVNLDYIGEITDSSTSRMSNPEEGLTWYIFDGPTYGDYHPEPRATYIPSLNCWRILCSRKYRKYEDDEELTEFDGYLVWIAVRGVVNGLLTMYPNDYLFDSTYKEDPWYARSPWPMEEKVIEPYYIKYVIDMPYWDVDLTTWHITEHPEPPPIIDGVRFWPTHYIGEWLKKPTTELSIWERPGGCGGEHTVDEYEIILYKTMLISKELTVKSSVSYELVEYIDKVCRVLFREFWTSTYCMSGTSVPDISYKITDGDNNVLRTGGSGGSNGWYNFTQKTPTGLAGHNYKLEFKITGISQDVFSVIVESTSPLYSLLSLSPSYEPGYLERYWRYYDLEW